MVSECGSLWRSCSVTERGLVLITSHAVTSPSVLLRECGSSVSLRLKSLAGVLSTPSCFFLCVLHTHPYNAYYHQATSYVCSGTAGLISPLEFIGCEVMSTSVPVPIGVSDNFRHVLTAWHWFQIRKLSDKCSPYFPKDVPTCSPHCSPPPPHLILFLCARVFL